MEFNHQTQHIATLGSLKMETGYVADVTAATGLTTTDLSETHSIPTTLNTVIGGWIYCNSSPGGVAGCITGAGSVCTGHTSGSAMVDFSLDASSELSDDYYVLFGW